jgi:hypothetical protein
MSFLPKRPVRFTEPLEIQKQVCDKAIPSQTVVKVTSCGANRGRCAAGKFDEGNLLLHNDRTRDLVGSRNPHTAACGTDALFASFAYSTDLMIARTLSCVPAFHLPQAATRYAIL